MPRRDCAIFADTHWEPPSVYAHLEWLEGWRRRPQYSPRRLFTAGFFR